MKIEEDLGNQLEASEGTLDAWNEMMQTVNAVAGQSSLLTPEAAYEKLDTLLDKDNFIDYMILNQYAGNGDWDYHNWYAIRRNNNKEGFKFLCWDSEIILGSANDNIVTKRDGYPTTIFHLLMTHEDFARRYLKRAKELLVLTDSWGSSLWYRYGTVCIMPSHRLSTMKQHAGATIDVMYTAGQTPATPYTPLTTPTWLSATACSPSIFPSDQLQCFHRFRISLLSTTL